MRALIVPHVKCAEPVGNSLHAAAQFARLDAWEQREEFSFQKLTGKGGPENVVNPTASMPQSFAFGCRQHTGSEGQCAKRSLQLQQTCS